MLHERHKRRDGHGSGVFHGSPQRRHGLGLIVIDYLQLIEPDDARSPRQEQVARITRRLKLMARELDVPIIALAQVNRQVEQSKNCRPRLAHLRESGAIEQDADNVLFVHRPEYYKRLADSEKPSEGNEPMQPVDHNKGEEAEILLAKARNAPTAEFKMYWFGRYQSWDNPAAQHIVVIAAH